MKTRTSKHLAGLVSLSALALGMIASTQSADAATQNIANTRHNLSNQRSGAGVNGGPAFGSTVGDIFTTGTVIGGTTATGSDQICVFCHTPHGSNTAVTTVPLWNRTIKTSGYTAYTMVGSNSTGTATVGGMSLACLSCHDGTQAMDAMFNAPGSGPGYGEGTAGAEQTGYLWTSGATVDLSNGGHNLNAPITYLGTDLSNDHPIGMKYCGGVSAAACLDGDFKSGTDGTGTNKAKIGVLKLFGDGTVANSTVECATCHDPHLEPSNGTQLFLRVTPIASAICLTCHTK